MLRPYVFNATGLPFSTCLRLPQTSTAVRVRLRNLSGVGATITLVEGKIIGYVRVWCFGLVIGRFTLQSFGVRA